MKQIGCSAGAANNLWIFINKKQMLRFVILLIILLLLMPRIPIYKVGYGELSVRIDGIISALVGILIFFLLRSKKIIINITLVGFLYIQNIDVLFVSAGLFFQILSILALPIFYSCYAKYTASNINDFLSNAKRFIVAISIFNIILALISRYFKIDICVDSIVNTGCLGIYGLLDRPYIFSIFIGAGFVALCLNEDVQISKMIILLIGLFICDSRSIAVIMFFLGFYVYIRQHNITLKIAVGIIGLVLILFNIIYFSEGKMSLSTLNFNRVDPSWQMRLDSIDNYFDWVNAKKFLIGNGALAFYEFSEQYGQPGPIDNLYFRLLSEVGLIGCILLLFIFIYPLYILAKKYKNKSLFLSYIGAIAIISIFQESIVTPRAGHILVLLGLCLVLQQKNNFRSDK